MNENNRSFLWYSIFNILVILVICANCRILSSDMIYFGKCVSFIVATDFKQFAVLGSHSSCFTSFCNVYVRKFSPTILPQVLLWLFTHTLPTYYALSCLCISPLTKFARKTSNHPAGRDLNITVWASILCTFCLYLSEQKQFFTSHLFFIITLCKNI